MSHTSGLDYAKSTMVGSQNQHEMDMYTNENISKYRVSTMNDLPWTMSLSWKRGSDCPSKNKVEWRRETPGSSSVVW